MLGNTETQDSIKRYFLRIRSKDANKAEVPVHFEVQELVDNEYKVTAKVNDLSGDLVNIYINDFEYQGKKSKAIKLHFQDFDRNELYILDLRISLLTRSLFNTLLSLTSFDGLKVGVYQGKPRANKKSYPMISVRQHGELVQWKYKLEELPKIQEIKTSAQTIRIYDELDAFYVAELEKLAVKLRERRKAAGRPTTAAPKATLNDTASTCVVAVPPEQAAPKTDEEFADGPPPEEDEAPF